MHLCQVKDKLKEFRFDSLRLDCDNHFEAVILKNELEKLKVQLASLFGEPVWPSKKKMSRQIEDMVNGFGGIMAGQTLYFWSKDKDTVFVMLWPWQDGEHTTIKAIQR